MGAFFPAGLKLVIDGFLAAQTALHVSWHTAVPSTAGSNEYVLNGIGRVAVGTLTTSSDTDSADGTNATAITSAGATGATAAITHIGIVTAATGGTFVAQDELGTAVTLALGEKIRIPAGDLDVSFPIA